MTALKNKTESIEYILPFQPFNNLNQQISNKLVKLGHYKMKEDIINLEKEGFGVRDTNTNTMVSNQRLVTDTGKQKIATIIAKNYLDYYSLPLSPPPSPPPPAPVTPPPLISGPIPQVLPPSTPPPKSQPIPFVPSPQQNAVVQKVNNYVNNFFKDRLYLDLQLLQRGKKLSVAVAEKRKSPVILRY